MDPIVLIAQVHASGPEAAKRLKKAGLGDLAALSRATPKRVAKILGVKAKSAQAIVRDAGRELESAPATPTRRRGKKKAPARTGSPRTRRAARADGLTRQETEVLLAEGGGDAGQQEEEAPPSGDEQGSTAAEKKVEQIPPDAPPPQEPESFWQFG